MRTATMAAAEMVAPTPPALRSQAGARDKRKRASGARTGGGEVTATSRAGTERGGGAGGTSVSRRPARRNSTVRSAITEIMAGEAFADSDWRSGGPPEIGRAHV